MSTIPTHIAKGEQLYFLDRVDSGHIWYKAQNCWGGPGCDEIQTIFPRHLENDAPAFEEWSTVVETPVDVVTQIPEPGTAVLVLGGLCVSLLVSLAAARILAFCGRGEDDDSHPTAQRTR